MKKDQKKPKIYCIPKINDIEKYLEFSQKENAAFEYNDFFIPSLLDKEGYIDEKVNYYRSLGRDTSMDNVHGAFLDVTVHSDDELIKKASDYRVRQSMDIGGRLGARAVIFHTNQIPNFRSPSYMDNWVKRNAEYWYKITSDYPETDVYIENMFDMWPDMLARLADELKDIKNFGVCFDIAHANIGVASVDEWIGELSSYIKHIHINDNDGVNDSHSPVGTGIVDWNIYNELMEKSSANPSVLIEVSNFENLIKSVEYMKLNKMAPFF